MAVRKIFITEISRTMMYAANPACARLHVNTHICLHVYVTHRHLRAKWAQANNEGTFADAAKLVRTHVRMRTSRMCVRSVFDSTIPVMSYRRHIDLPFRRPIFPLSHVCRCRYYGWLGETDGRIAYLALWKSICKQFFSFSVSGKCDIFRPIINNDDGLQ